MRRCAPTGLPVPAGSSSAKRRDINRAWPVVLQTLIVNWDYVGGSRGAYVIRPNEIDIFGIQPAIGRSFRPDEDQIGLW